MTQGTSLAVMWTCLDCGFSFDAQHEDEGGGYTCPVCEVDDLRAQLVTLEAKQKALPSLLHTARRAEKLERYVCERVTHADDCQRVTNTVIRDCTCGAVERAIEEQR